MASMMTDTSLDPDELITEFLAVSRHGIAGIWVAFFSRRQRSRCRQGYYKEAAPFVREYLDTMHGSIADTSFYMVRLSPGVVVSASEASCFACREERSAHSHVLSRLSPVDWAYFRRRSWQGENFDHTAPFLTPMALLTSAQAFQNALKLPGLSASVLGRLQVTDHFLP